MAEIVDGRCCHSHCSYYLLWAAVIITTHQRSSWKAMLSLVVVCSQEGCPHVTINLEARGPTFLFLPTPHWTYQSRRLWIILSRQWNERSSMKWAEVYWTYFVLQVAFVFWRLFLLDGDCLFLLGVFFVSLLLSWWGENLKLRKKGTHILKLSW